MINGADAEIYFQILMICPYSKREFDVRRKNTL
jgi:hypothetical protein